jgi:hypothetical protein
MVELWFLPLLGLNFKFQLNWDSVGITIENIPSSSELGLEFENRSRKSQCDTHNFPKGGSEIVRLESEYTVRRRDSTLRCKR